MKMFGLTLLASSILLAGCSDNDSSSSSRKDTPATAASLQSALTTSTSYDDIADAALWVSPENNHNNLLIVTLEEDGLAVYNQQGDEIFHDDSREVLGADIRYGIEDDQGNSVDVLVVALPDEEALAFYAVSGDTDNPLTELGTLAIDMEAEAVCLYKNVTTGDLTATGVSEDGGIIQYKVEYDGANIVSALTDQFNAPLPVRNVNVGGELSACIIDDESATLYVAEQDLGIWAYGSDAENVKERRLVDSIEPLGHLQEIEGLDIAYQANGKGYLVVADEGAGFLFYERANDNPFVTRFNVENIEEAKALAIAPDAFWLANTEADDPVYEKVLLSDLNNYLTQTSNQSLTNLISHRELSVEDVALVASKGETTEVDDDGDAADDPAFWVHPTDVSKSLIIATNKQGGLMAYDLAGNELQYLNEGEPNNVDIRNVTDWNGDTIALAAASNRALNTISLYKISEATDTQDPIQPLTAIGNNVHNDAAELVSNVDEVYGLCMYQANDGTPYVFINGKDGNIEQWQLTLTETGIQGEIVRQLSVNSQPEGCVADDEAGVLYLGEEDKAIWQFDASANGSQQATLFTEIDGEELVADVEGLTLYNSGNEKYLIASSQGNNTYVVYDLNNNNQSVGTFAIIGNDQQGLDGASDTDGIHAVAVNLGDDYPEGMFIAQDWYNIDDQYRLENQNFKMVSWKDIIESLQIN
ncbi:phytase [Litoribacillus peritrichatus]|uniref:Phytase n=1 Tax=Litoribacillus peritrichatus TaxID=718191 RepID=A0ABP7MVA5_9GAMM